MPGDSNRRPLRAVAAASAFLACAFTASGARADVVILPALNDATIYLGNTSNSTSGPGMFIGDDSGGASTAKRGLIEFNIAGGIPAGSTINSASLTLYLGQVAGSGGGGGDQTARTIELHKLTSSWHGGTNGATGFPGSATNHFGGLPSAGFPANSGDPTWAYSSFNTAAWNTAGGDFSSTVSGSTLVSQNLDQAYTWSSSQMASDVKSWLDDPSTNDGWLLRNTDETDTKTFRAFFTREGAAEQNLPNEAPVLTIDFTPVPEPSLGVSATLLALLSTRKRRKRIAVRIEQMF